MTCDFGKQNDIIKCKCDVVMTTDLGNLQSVPESLAITKPKSNYLPNFPRKAKRQNSLMW